MPFDYLAALDGDRPPLPEHGRVWNLASGFGDRAAVDSVQHSEDARKYYRKHCDRAIRALPSELSLDGDSHLSQPGWFSLDVHFTLYTPWYSKDDRPFHVLDNPVRKDRVFGVPFLSAAGWKGLLRWACRMKSGLLKHLELHDNHIRGWTDPAWIVHLFGNEKGEDDDFERGALAFRPSWFDKVGFEVINPHDRKRRAGNQPIMYEVVPPGTKGTLRLLYAPLPGEAAPDETIPKLFSAVDMLLTVYGISAKRTAGWGACTVESWDLAGVGGKQVAKSANEAVSNLNAVRFTEGRP